MCGGGGGGVGEAPPYLTYHISTIRFPVTTNLIPTSQIVSC